MKVVINACFGGFSLSPHGIKAYAERKGWPCYFFTWGVKEPRRRLTDEEAFASTDFMLSAFRTPEPPTQPSGKSWAVLSDAEKAASNKLYDEAVIYDRDIPRDDPDLVAVVEQLGAAADGRCAGLRVVEIPDDVEWQIEEYDGNEHIAEKHRVWP